MLYYTQISRAATLRSWEASNESLRNFIGMTRRMALPHKSSFASSDVSFRALSGASFDASEEVFVPAPVDVWNGTQILR